jgi:hypothetical protein
VVRLIFVTLTGSVSRRNATNRSILGVLLLALGALAVLAAAADSASARVVSFHGYRLSVPSSWRVYDLAREPSTCVRFNRHAVYLGAPSASQRCPAHAVGRTGAILLSPLAASGASRGAAPASAVALPSAGGSAASFVIGSADLIATATWSHDRALVSRILGRRLVAGGLAARTPARARPHPLARAAATATAPPHPVARANATATAPRSRSAQSVYGGLGFDACAAPSTSTMSAWAASPYRAVGIYIGGVNEGCSQPNLTSAWVGGEVLAGWHLIPTYVGLQGVGSCDGTCSTIDPSQASAEGTAAADDAVSHAEALGIPAGNPIYDDMEQYSAGTSNTPAVLAYLSGWTTELHAAGYQSGVYSSASSAITDLVNQSGTGYAEPDDIWIGDWNGQQTVSDPYVPSSDWTGQQRLHQYQGAHNETYGGVELNIDSDFLDGATADTSSPIPDGTFVQVTGDPAVYEIAGGAPLYVSAWTQFGGPQLVIEISAQEFASLRPYPADGTFVQTTGGSVYRVAGGAPIGVSSWAVFGGVQPDVTIDQWDIDNISSPLSHLLSAPVDGTVVEGLPSDTYWSFGSGLRAATTPTACATQVDDAGLTTFAQTPQTGGVQPGGVGVGVCAVAATKAPLAKPVKYCVAPRLKHMTLARARAALRRADCTVAKIRRPRHVSRHHLLHVFGQSVPVHSKRSARYGISLRLL